MLQGLEGEQYILEIKKPTGKIFELTVSHSKCTETEVYPKTETSGNLIEFKWYENQVAYVALNSFQDESIDSFL
jgi:hypothetical protein